MKKLITVTIIFLAVSMAAVAQTSDWVRYAPEGKGFSILLPQKPTLEDDAQPSGRTIHRAYSADREIKDSAFLATYWDFPSTTVFSLDKLVDSVAPDDRRQIISESNISLDGYAGREIQIWKTISEHDYKFQVRTYIIGQRVYMLTCIIPKEADASLAKSKAAKFFDSFSIRSGN